MLPSLRLVIYLGHIVIDDANTGADPFTGRPMQLTTQLRASSMIIYAAGNLTRGSRVSCLAQTGFVVFDKGVQLMRVETKPLSRLTSPSAKLATS